MIEQARITARLIKERIFRDKMAIMEEWHQEESSGAREELVEQEQIQQEHETTSNVSDNFFSNSDQDDVPRNIAEPSVEITLADIGGEDDLSLSLLIDIDGTNESYPIDGVFPAQQLETEQLDLLLTNDY